MTVGLSGCGALQDGAQNGSARSWPGPPEVILGSGVLHFLPMRECARVPIIHGGQGGYHIWGSIRARYLDFHQPTVAFTVADPEGTPLAYAADIRVPKPFAADFTAVDPAKLTVGDAERGAPPACDDGGYLPDGGVPTVPGSTDGWGELLGSVVYLPYSRTDGGLYLPTDVDGVQIRVEVRVTDASGRTATDVRMPVPYYQQ